MRVGTTTRRIAAFLFAGGIGTVGIQDVETDGSTDFTSRGRTRGVIQRPIERDDDENDQLPICAIDIETTGVMPRRDAIIEIAAIRTDRSNGTTHERVFQELVRPSGNIPKNIREKTGITNETVARADTIDQVLPRLQTFIGNARLIAHNAHFDRRFLEHNARLMGRTFAENEWVCTMRMAQRVPVGKPYGLAGLAERLQLGEQTEHRALPDCRLTMHLYRTLYGLLDGEISLTPMTPPDEDAPAHEVEYDADLTGQVFVFSGFRDEVLAARIQNAGGRIASTASKKVTTVLVADASAPPTGKVKKAIEERIPVQSKAKFESEFYINNTGS